MTVIEKVRETCRRLSTSEAHYNFLLEKVCIIPGHRNNECSKPDSKCDKCENNRFNFDKFNKIWRARGEQA